MIPKKLGRYSFKDNKQYEHVCTKEEKQKILLAQLEGKSTQLAIKEIRESLTDKDWVEVQS